MTAIPILGEGPFKPKAPTIIKGAAYWTPRVMAKNAVAPGRKEGQTAGTHLDNLIANRRLLTLSPAATRKFTTPKGKSLCERSGYVLKRSMPLARAWCDATGNYHPECFVFFPKELT